jgi:hypothetical protein
MSQILYDIHKFESLESKLIGHEVLRIPRYLYFRFTEGGVVIASLTGRALIHTNTFISVFRTSLLDAA